MANPHHDGTISRVSIRNMMRFLRHLAESPDQATVDRYRESQGEELADLCTSCGVYPVASYGRCFSCATEDRLPC